MVFFRIYSLLSVLLLAFLCFDVCSTFSIHSSSALKTKQAAPHFKMFKATYPLEGGPSQLRLHVAVILEDICSGPVEGESYSMEEEDTKRRFVLFDFLPEDPTAVTTAVRLFTGQDVQGYLRERELRYLPSNAICVGSSYANLEDMRAFVKTYPNRLSLLTNNCVSFVNAFIKKHSTREV